MSRKGNCYDNAPMESFWGVLKNEQIYHCRYDTRQEAIQDITEYIEIFYNRQRLQERLGFLSPVAYEQRYYARQISPTTNHIQPRPSTVIRPEPAGQSRASDSSGKAPALDGPRVKATLSAGSRLRTKIRVRPLYSGEDGFRVHY